MSREEIMAWLDKVAEAQNTLADCKRDGRLGEDVYLLNEDKEVLCNGVERIANELGWPYVTEKLKFNASFHDRERYIWHRGIKFFDFVKKGE